LKRAEVARNDYTTTLATFRQPSSTFFATHLQMNKAQFSGQQSQTAAQEEKGTHI
jgi:hypothetical protein